MKRENKLNTVLAVSGIALGFILGVFAENLTWPESSIPKTPNPKTIEIECTDIGSELRLIPDHYMTAIEEKWARYECTPTGWTKKNYGSFIR